MKIGNKMISLYFVVAYLLPLIGNYLFQPYIHSEYKLYPANFYVITLVLAIYFLYLLISKVPFLIKINPSFFVSYLNKIGELYMRWRWCFVMLAVILALVNLCFGMVLNDYRYAHESLSERHSGVLLLFIVFITIILADLFYYIFLRPQRYQKRQSSFKTRANMESLCLSIALFILADGTATAFLALFSLFYCLCSNFTISLFYNNIHDGFIKKTCRMMVSCVMVTCIFVPSWFYGETIKGSLGAIFSPSEVLRSLSALPEAIKTSIIKPKTVVEPAAVTQAATVVEPAAVTQAATVIEPAAVVKPTSVIEPPTAFSTFRKEVLDYTGYIIERFSISYYSLVFTTEIPKETYDRHISFPLSYPINTFLFRLNYLLGHPFSLSKPDIGSISQLNYRLLTIHPDNKREGSSPGLIASFNYIFSFPWNILFCVFYLYFLSKMIQGLLYCNNKVELSLSGMILAFIYLQVFFQSPFDFLSVIDNSVIYMLIIIGIYFNKRNVLKVDSQATEREALELNLMVE